MDYVDRLAISGTTAPQRRSTKHAPTYVPLPIARQWT